MSGRWVVFSLALAACGDNAPPTCGNFEAGGVVVSGGNVYWTDDNAGLDGSTPRGFVWRQAVSGGVPTRFATIVGYPDRMTLAANALVVGGGCGGGIWSVPLDGRPAAMIAQVTDSDVCIHGVTVADQAVYFTSGGVWKASLADGPVVELVPPPASFGCSNDIVVDATRAYWASSCYNTLSAVSLVGGPVTVIDQGSPEIGVGGYGAVARDETNLYWAGDGAIKTMPLAGGPIATFATIAPARVASIAVDVTTVFWTTVDGVFAAPRGGGSVGELATLEPASSIIHGGGGPGLALDDTHVYSSSGCAPDQVPK